MGDPMKRENAAAYMRRSPSLLIVDDDARVNVMSREASHGSGEIGTQIVEQPL